MSLPRHPLADLRARLDRADKHIIDLETVIADAKRLHPHSSGTHLNPHTGEWYCDVDENAPPEVYADLSVRAGEIVFLLRSSLDHLVAQLLIPMNPPLDIDEVLKKSEFPIFDDATKYGAFYWRKNKNIAPKARKAIDDLQPCNRTDGLPPKDHPLAILQSLNNIDKHRMLLRVITNVHASIYASIQELDKPMGFTHVSISTAQPTTKVVAGRINRGETVDVYVNSTFDKAFQNVGSGKDEPIIPLLQKLLKAVRAVVDDFDNFFFQGKAPLP